MKRQGSAGTSSSAFDAPGLSQIGLIALIANLVGLFYWTWIAAITLAYVALVLSFVALAARGQEGEDDVSVLQEIAQEVGGWAALSSFAVALVGGALAGGLQWPTFKLVALIVVGLFTISVVLYILGGALGVPAALASLLLAAVMAGALFVLPAPPGSLERKWEEAQVTQITATVRDASGLPLGDAQVCLSWKSRGARDPSDLGDCDRTSVDGATLHRLLGPLPGDVALLRASREDYSDGRSEIDDIKAGEQREVTITLARRAR